VPILFFIIAQLLRVAVAFKKQNIPALVTHSSGTANRCYISIKKTSHM